ncbi:thiolase family protein [Streptomyces sp. NPDC050388]|uniref:thiolase family protein n=1 Tax=Streptomyces sp. NPDC050388 TaxID=3155781 RepID=UPI00341220FE
MNDVYLIGAHSTAFGRYGHLSFRDLTRQACEGVLRDAGGAGVGASVGSVWFGNAMMSYWGQHCTRGHFCLVPLIQEGLLPAGVPLLNVEGACATGSMAFQGAVKDIASGEHDLALAVGVEKLYRPGAPKQEMFDMFRAAENALDPHETLDEYHSLMAGLGRSFETGPGRTMFMDTYAAQAVYHMERFGTTQRQLAAVAAKNHAFAVHNERAQYRFEMSVEEVLADRPVTYPLTRSMCAPIGDGAAAVLVCSADYLASQPEAVRQRAVRVAATTLTSGHYRKPDEPSLTRLAASRAYARAGITPGDIDVAEVHDATAFGEIYQAEMLGFCEIGEGGKFVEAGETDLGGSVPVNTSGGLLAKGHPVAASGLSMLTEVTVQLRGEAGPRQVTGATRGLIENGGGIMGLEEAACAVTILERLDA